MAYQRTIRTLVLLAAVLSFVSPGRAQLFPFPPFGNHPIAREPGVTLSPNSPNGPLTITAVQNTDISGAVSAALASVRSTCGTVIIAPGTYVWATSGVQMLPCETLEGTGATVLVNVGGATPPPFLIVVGPTPPNPSTDSTYTVGNIRGVTFVGPSATPASQTASMGIQLGGTTSADTAQLINLYDVHIRGFGCGLNVQWAFQIAVFGGSIDENYDGVCFANIITFLENINFHGTQFLANVDYGINQNQTGANVELNLISCSLDYNGQHQSFGGQVQITNGKLIVLGGHFESDRLPMITVPVPGAPAIADVFVTGTAFNIADTRTSDSYASFFLIKGVNNVLELGRGVSFASQGATVSAVANWMPTVNQNSRLLADPYTYIVGTVPLGLPAYVGTAPNNYNFPTYDSHDNVTGISKSY